MYSSNKTVVCVCVTSSIPLPSFHSVSWAMDKVGPRIIHQLWQFQRGHIKKVSRGEISLLTQHSCSEVSILHILDFLALSCPQKTSVQLLPLLSVDRTNQFPIRKIIYRINHLGFFERQAPTVRLRSQCCHKLGSPKLVYCLGVQLEKWKRATKNQPGSPQLLWAKLVLLAMHVVEECHQVAGGCPHLLWHYRFTMLFVLHSFVVMLFPNKPQSTDNKMHCL